MQEYQDYKDQMKTLTAKADKDYETLGGVVHWLFVAVCVFISAGATFYLNHKGLENNSFYASTIGTERAAWLVVFAVDGSLVGLLIGVSTFLKSAAQRSLASFAITATKVILSVNVLVAFVLLSGVANGVLPAVQLYTQWGAPLTVCAALWLWPELLLRRRKNVMMAAALDAVAERDNNWQAQHAKDQQAHLTAYQSVMGSDEMKSFREQIAAEQAISQIAKDAGIPLEQARAIHARMGAKNAPEPEAQRPRLQIDADQPRYVNGTAWHEDNHPNG